uniref:AlNc14C80G5272 protein n=1 Tax=Albugo laibachii Nc14 TaxID=890382 RepID=F0WF80_9STRA|nr:AlNc14C80G5272 [Albugo laibachii Nc14]|eukprot:CCA19862.1 AlNc14C80G5272 [Albugo laibachii Nc14]
MKVSRKEQARLSPAFQTTQSSARTIPGAQLVVVEQSIRHVKLKSTPEKNIVALEKLAESQRLAANNQIMCTNVEFLDEVARKCFMLQRRRILRDLCQQEQEIELVHAVIMATDPKLISLTDEDADAPSVALEVLSIGTHRIHPNLETYPQH